MTALWLALMLAAPGERAYPDTQPTVLRETAELASIYERPGFERARERNSGALQALFAQARAWFMALFETTGAETYSNVTRVLVLAAALAVGLFAALRLRARKARLAASAPGPLSAPLELDDPAVHRARAEALLASNPREAIREALLSLLAALERRHFARPDRTRTNRELHEALPRNGAPPELVAAIAPLFSWFDRAFYSLGDVTPADARRFLDDVNKVTA